MIVQHNIQKTINWNHLHQVSLKNKVQNRDNSICMTTSVGDMRVNLFEYWCSPKNIALMVRSLLLASIFQSVVKFTSALRPSVTTSILKVVTSKFSFRMIIKDQIIFQSLILIHAHVNCIYLILVTGILLEFMLTQIQITCHILLQSLTFHKMFLSPFTFYASCSKSSWDICLIFLIT